VGRRHRYARKCQHSIDLWLGDSAESGLIHPCAIEAANGDRKRHQRDQRTALWLAGSERSESRYGI
jgi:hypothetical protein